jgi:hypothetical protein
MNGSVESQPSRDTYLQMQSYKQQLPASSSWITQQSADGEGDRVKVYARVRPAFPREIRQDETALSFRNLEAQSENSKRSERANQDYQGCVKIEKQRGRLLPKRITLDLQ